ncbi:Abi-alpha family protein [uncultured Jatrophihabitans sp.]|uniref:Abi-alpha family protein n=1 Tax=uncultured Jatrophihabitans sp. TaxID=1610747 RepID=UPI0035C993D3
MTSDDAATESIDADEAAPSAAPAAAVPAADAPAADAPAADVRATPAGDVARRPRPGSASAVRAGVAMRRPSPSLVRAAPDVARVAAVSAWRVFSWSLGATVASANYVAQRAIDGDPPTAILQDAANDLRNVAWRALGVREDIAPHRPAPDRAAPKPSTPQDLQRRGTDLLRRSNDVHVVEDTHPAFARILTEITPDEARMLRYLYLEGPQPAIDVRTFRPFGIGSVLIAGGLNMIAEHAGCRNLERSAPYLTNLSRLGLIIFSKEQVTNPQRYQVVEAQPKVTDAMKRAGRMPKTIHRSIQLTEFGQEFVRTCLPLNGRVIPQRSLGPDEGRS